MVRAPRGGRLGPDLQQRLSRHGALHPLAPSGPDVVPLRADRRASRSAPARGGTLRLLRVEVTPRRTGPALIAGQMWIDSATAEVVRLTFRYVGTALWAVPERRPRGADSAEARRINRLANDIVSVDADLEYGLQDGRYWMPYRRQVIAGRVRIPIVSDLVVPFRATTTFEDYRDQHRPPDRVRGAAARIRPRRRRTREAERARRDSLRAERSHDRDTRTACVPGTTPTAGRAAGTSCTGPPNATLDRYRRVARFAVARDRPRGRAPPARGGGRARAAWPRRCRTRVTGRRAHGFGYERTSRRLPLQSGAGPLGRSRLPGADRRACRSPISYGDGALRIQRRAGDRPPERRCGTRRAAASR